MTDDCSGETITAPTGRGRTTMIDALDRPSLLAVIVTVPAVTPTTSPVDETVATVDALDDHAINRPLSAAPVESRAVAVSCVL